MNLPHTVQLSSRLQEHLTVTSQQLTEFCQRWQVSELSLFGSILRGDFNVDSDIDVLVTYKPTARRGLFKKITMKEELSSLLHREVDLVSRKAIEQSHNWLRHKNILSSAEVIYIAQSRSTN